MLGVVRGGVAKVAALLPPPGRAWRTIGKPATSSPAPPSSSSLRRASMVRVADARSMAPANANSASNVTRARPRLFGGGASRPHTPNRERRAPADRRWPMQLLSPSIRIEPSPHSRSPSHPAKIESAAAMAVGSTTVPLTYSAEHWPELAAGVHGAIDPVAADGPLTAPRAGDLEPVHGPSETRADLIRADVTGGVLRTRNTARIGEVFAGRERDRHDVRARDSSTAARAWEHDRRCSADLSRAPARTRR